MSTSRRLRIGLPLLLVLALPFQAAAAEPGAGHWEGSIQLPGQEVAIAVDLSLSDGGGWTGTLAIPAQGLSDFPLGDVGVDGGVVTFKMPGVPGEPTYRGTLSADTQSIAGTVSQAGQTFPFALQRRGEVAAREAAAPVPSDLATALAGTWSGALSTPGGAMTIVFHVANADGRLSATMDSPDQGQTGLPVTSVTAEGEQVRFDLQYAGAVFAGTRSPDGASLVGAWNQAGTELPLTLSKVGAGASAPAPASARGAAAVGAAFTEASPESQGIPPRAKTLLRQHVQGLVDSEAIVGGEIAVIKNRRVVMREAFGWKDREAKTPLQPGALYCVRSMTKPLTGTMIQMLIDEGKLSRDTLVKDLIPSFDTKASQAMTVGHLLTNSSGLPLTVIDRQLDEYAGARGLADAAAAHGPDFLPGSRFQYSDPGSDTLAAIVEIVSGQPVASFVQDRILTPLRMLGAVAVLEEDDERLAQVPTAYSGGTGSWQAHWKPSAGRLFPYFLGSQGLYSTTVDYARFLSLWMDGGTAEGTRLLSADAVTRALTPRFDMSSEYPGGMDGMAVHYGEQWMSWTEGAGPVTRPAVFGHGGSDGTHAWAWPEEDLMVLFFTQSRGAVAGLKLEGLLQRWLVAGDLSEPAPSWLQGSEQLAPYLGLWVRDPSGRGFAAVTRHGEHLALELPGRAFLVFVPGTGPDTFVSEATDQLRLEFPRRAGGAVGRFILHEGEEAVPHRRLVVDNGLPSVAKLLRRVQKAHGRDHLTSGSGVRFEGVIESELRGSGTVTTTLSGSGQLQEVEMAGLQIRVGIDGEEAWAWNEMAGLSELSGGQRDQALLEHPARRWGDWTRHHEEVRVLRRRVIDDESVFIVWTWRPETHGSLKYVRASDGLLVREDRFTQVPGVGTVGTTVRYDDFRKVGRLRYPFRTVMDTRHPLIGQVVVRHERARAHVAVPRDAYEPPVAETAPGS